jgi:hypothetical protein
MRNLHIILCILFFNCCNDRSKKVGIENSDSERKILSQKVFVEMDNISLVVAYSNVDTLYCINLKGFDNSGSIQTGFSRDIFKIPSKRKKSIVAELLLLGEYNLPSSRKIANYSGYIDSSGRCMDSYFIPTDTIQKYSPIPLSVEALFLINLLTQSNLWYSASVPILSNNNGEIAMDSSNIQRVFAIYKKLLVNYDGKMQPKAFEVWYY